MQPVFKRSGLVGIVRRVVSRLDGIRSRNRNGLIGVPRRRINAVWEPGRTRFSQTIPLGGQRPASLVHLGTKTLT